MMFFSPSNQVLLSFTYYARINIFRGENVLYLYEHVTEGVKLSYRSKRRKAVWTRAKKETIIPGWCALTGVIIVQWFACIMETTTHTRRVTDTDWNNINNHDVAHNWQLFSCLFSWEISVCLMTTITLKCNNYFGQ